MDRRGRDRLRSLEEALGAQIAEVRADVSDKDLEQAARAGSSVGRVKSLEDYRRDRQLAIDALLQIPTAKQVDVQLESLTTEYETCTQSPYTPTTLPLLLHQYYCDRIGQLVQLKHMLLVRWARFAIGQPKVTETLQDKFQETMENLMMEYNDALNSARRLAVSHDAVLAEKAPPTSLVGIDDILPYLRWKVFHQHTIKDTAAFLLGVRWYPLLFSLELGQALCANEATPALPTKRVCLSVPQSKWLSASRSFSVVNAFTKLQSQSKTSQLSQTSFLAPPSSVNREGSSPSCTPRHTHFTSTTAAGGGGGGATSVDNVTMPSALEQGQATNDGMLSGSLPLHTTDVNQLRDLLQELMLAYSIGGSSNFQSSSEQLQLYYKASRKFREVFEHQEQLITFPTFDSPSDGEGGAKRSKPRLTFRKPSTWLPYITIKPDPDHIQIAAFVKMREAVKTVDPLLSLSSHCSHLRSAQRALYALKQHSISVTQPSQVMPLSVASHKTPHDTLLVWKCIYSGGDIRDPLGTSDSTAGPLADYPEGEAEGNGTGGETADVKSSNQDSDIKVPEAMKLIHNQDGRAVSSSARSAPRDAYFAFLLLRHLRIREMRTKCLAILNYFRSVERTLTINQDGLSQGLGSGERGSRPSSLNHRHLFNTPADYVISETEFMQYTEIENHDDFHAFSSSSSSVSSWAELPVRVWDCRGTGVMYDAALEDLRKLEEELMVVGSFYIHALTEGGARKRKMAGDVDINSQSKRGVDRFAVLLDLWAAEARFLEAKMKVINCYLEAYHHVYDRKEKERLTKVIVTLFSARPRHAPSSAYFTSVYSQECRCLKAHYQLLRAMINHQLSEERAYNQCVYDSSGPNERGSCGLPPPLVKKQLVSLSGDRQLLIHSHLLEFCNSLCVVASLPQAVEWTLAEILHQHNVSSPLHVITLHRTLLELMLTEWEQRADLGAAYTPELQKQLFTDVCMENPHMLSEVCLLLSKQPPETEGGDLDDKQRKQLKAQAWADLLQLTSVRHHLLLVCSETQLLTRLYKQQLSVLEQEECHAHLRCSPFDHTMKLLGGKDLGHFVGQAREESSQARLDRYIPARLNLAVQELDEKHLGKFNLRSQDGVMKVLTGKNGLDNVSVTLQCQVAHRNALVMACQQNAFVQQHTASHTKEGSELLEEARSHASMISSPAIPAHPQPISSTASQVAQDIQLAKLLKRAFVSLQQEKTPVRDYMLAQFTNQPSAGLRGQHELEKTKICLVQDYCSNLMRTMGHLSLRAQVMRSYANLQKLLEDFPATRDAYFTVGKVTGSVLHDISESTSRKISTQLGIKDARQYRSRPPAVLSKDGKRLLNLWYIPHFTEILIMFSDLPHDDCCRALSSILHLVTPLYDLLQYVCAYVRLGSSHAHQGSRGGSKQIGGSWGGTEGIGSELHQLQVEVSRLGNPSDPAQVGEYLATRCRVLYLEHSVTVEHYVFRTLMLTGNTAAIQTLQSVSAPSIRKLDNHPTPHLCYPMLSAVPTPMDLLPTARSRDLLPWKHFLSTRGPFPGSLDHRWEIGAYLYVSLAVMGPNERSIANGEILGLTLLLEDVLQDSELVEQLRPPSGLHPLPLTTTRRASRGRFLTTPDEPPTAPQRSSSPSQESTSSRHSRLSSRRLSLSASGQHVSATTALPPATPTLLQVPPLEGARLMERFMFVTAQVERFKREWGAMAVDQPVVSTAKQLQQVEEAYKENVLDAARKWVAKQQLRELAKTQVEIDPDDTVSVTTFMTEATTGVDALTAEDLAMADNLNELKLREAQLSRLQELLTHQMIHKMHKRLSRLHHLVLSERQRDYATLPLDLWKRSSMKEILGLPRAHVVEDFLSQLTTKMTDKADVVTIPRTHLKECVQQLASGVLARERECYQMYASYYESILLGQYNQLYKKGREIEHYRLLAEDSAHQTWEQGLVFLGQQVQSLVLEITALRARVAELERQLGGQEEEVRRRVQQEYSALVDDLTSTSVAVKNRFEDYRSELYGDVVASLHEVRQAVAGNVGKMREKLGLQASDSMVAMDTSLQGNGLRDVQDENSELNRMVLKMRTMNQWNRTKGEVAHEQELSSLRLELDRVRTQSLELRMSSEEEILSLNQQVQALQKRLGKSENDCDVLRQTLADERQKQVGSAKSGSKAQGTSGPKADQLQAVKVDQLVEELEDKNRQLRKLTADRDRAKRHSELEHSRRSHAVKHMTQQLHHERVLKREAFHQVEDLLAQVHDHDQQQHASLRASLHTLHRPSAKATPSSFVRGAGRGSSPSPQEAHRRPSTQHSRQRTSSNGEMIDLSQEILALKLI